MSADAALRERFPHLRKQVPLAAYSTYRIGGPARLLLEATSVEDLADAARIARKHGLPYVLLGSGSNTLIADGGYDGLVIVARAQELSFEGARATADAGVKLSVLTVMAARHGLGGLDVLIGVPGTVGGATYGNAGGRDIAIGDRITAVTVLDDHGRVRTIPRGDCAFAYRSSRFKRTREPILRVRLELLRGDRVALEARIARVVREKNAKQPTHDQSAGCLFKNVVVEDPDALPPALREAVTDGQLSAWRLIVAAGLQGTRLGNVQVSPRHANFLVNLGGARAEEVAMLISYLKQQVRDRFHIQLHEEVQYLGFEHSKR